MLSIGLGGSDEFREGFGDDGDLLATLVTGKLNRDGVKVFADVMANEVAANPDGTDIDSNPVGILRKGNGYVIADAGGNAIVRVSKKGTFTTSHCPGQRSRRRSSGCHRARRSRRRRADLGRPRT